MTAERRAAAVLAAHQTHGDHLAGWTFVCACGFKTNFVGARRAHVADALAAANLLIDDAAADELPEQADDGQATGEPDGLRAAVEALAADWEATVYKLPPGYPMTVNEFCRYWFKDPLRAALAANPPTSGSETDRG